MVPPQPHPDEAARLATLYSLGLLDTKAEERFDRCVRIAKRLFDVPIALVSLVDADRQWFKANVGLDACQTGRDVSFCGHAILQNRTLVVPNTSEDPRFHDNPLVTAGPTIGFYAGVPLRIGDGPAVGTLCIIDRRPRTIEADLHLLEDLAAMVVSELGSTLDSNTDALTGALNRRGFECAARPILELSRRNDQPATLVYLDLDRFKEINDTHGHDAGDDALVEITSLLRGAFRSSDVVARLGGDEFAVLCTNLRGAQVPAVLGRLATAVDAANERRLAPWKLAYSAGHATAVQDDDPSLEALLAQADTAMFEEKRTCVRSAAR